MANDYQQIGLVSRLFDLVTRKSLVLYHWIKSMTLSIEVDQSASTARRSNQLSTRKDPSEIEYAERRTRPCGTCRQPGHNVLQCTQRLASQTLHSQTSSLSPSQPSHTCMFLQLPL
ncbi:hypothetical protein BCR42DRAFT_436382 [Absidia repens]|uniref:Uncharacterized protein n=1 Tax=Absidia repens TaxID=90262 RepID=A0A1X2IMR7_9FUNG|nr:hypothetical protein BCR42DRAFT_436382 [Absidia repens]